MRRVNVTITFKDEDGPARCESQDVESSYAPEPGGEHRLAHILFTELKVSIAEHTAPKHNALARGWLDFPKRSAGLEQHFDIWNSRAVWFELTNLVMSAEADLILAQAYKALEPPQEPSFDDDAAINDLYHIHDRKMILLNQSVHGLIKVQDLVNRLLHESLGGDLVDTSKPEWERTQLLRSNLEKGLETKYKAGLVSQSDFDAIVEALSIPENTPKGKMVRTYRNRLMHHLRPSVDYSIFFSALESREGEEIRNADGQIIGRRHTVRARAPVEYHFEELHGAFSEYLDALVAMLQKLSEIEILR